MRTSRRLRWATLASLVLPLLAGPSLHDLGALPALVASPARTEPNVYPLYLPLVNPPARPTTPVTVSQAGALLDAPIEVRLSTAEPAATIYFTLDGTEPRVDRGQVYVAPLVIDRTTTLRAMAYRSGQDPSPVATRTFVFPDEVLHQPPEPACRREPGQPPCFPVHWGYFPTDYPSWSSPGAPVPADYEMDPKVLARVGPEALKSGLRALPSLSLVMDPADLFDPVGGIYANPLGLGLAWERPASVELIQPDGRPGFQVNCGVRVAGRWSRMPDSTAKHSFSLRFKSQYGPKKLDYPLFPGSDVHRFDTLRLRAGQADSFNYFPGKAQFVHDQWARDTQRDMGWLSADGIFVHLYVNGLYWGLYNLTEEPTAHFAADHLGGAAEDWDVLKEGREVEDGDAAAYEALLALAAEGPPTPERYERVQGLLDLPQFADYHLLEIFGANWDWPLNNWRAARNRVTGEGFQFFVWDMEHMIQLDTYGVDGSNADTAGVDGLHGWLKSSAEYRLLFADRVQRHLAGAGALTPAANWERYRRLADGIESAMVAESARWGDVVPGRRAFGENRDAWCRHLARCEKECQPANAAVCPQLVDLDWLPERDRLRDVFFPQRTAVVVQQLCDQGLYPPVAPPRLDPPGGPGPAPARLVMAPDLTGPGCAAARTDGVLYYTLDGSDPREAWTGRPAPTARAYAGPLRLPWRARVTARALVTGPDGPLWSAAVAAEYGLPRLAISEIMYHPPADEDQEFLELVNREAYEVDLSGVTTTGITITLPAGARLGPFEHGVLVANSDAFTARYAGVTVLGEYTGRLSNGGERLTVSAPTGEVLADVTYDDEGFWPRSPDGRGWSLVLEGPGADPADPEAWRASSQPGGSPGVADAPPPYQVVQVNEVLPRAAAPREPAVELYNPGPATAFVGGWGLTDDLDVPFRHRLPPGATIPPGGFAVIYQAALGFPLSPLGGEVFVVGAGSGGEANGLMLGVAHGPAEDGRSFGRFRSSVGVAFPALARPTFGVDDPTAVDDFRRGSGAPNVTPWVGPVVLNEVMYHPAGDQPEYVELHNPGSEPVWLADPADPLRRWRLAGGVDAVFPEGTVLPPGGYLLVSGVEPWRLRQAYDVPPAVPVVGPWSGKLDNAGEAVELLRPLALDDGAVADGRVDGLHYGDTPPWRTAADGQGPSLERVDPTGYGDEPNNWLALSRSGTPGRANTPVRRVWLPFAVDGR